MKDRGSVVPLSRIGWNEGENKNSLSASVSRNPPMMPLLGPEKVLIGHICHQRRLPSTGPVLTRKHICCHTPLERCLHLTVKPAVVRNETIKELTSAVAVIAEN